MAKVRFGKRYRDFLDGTFTSSKDTLKQEEANKRANELLKQGYLVHITSHKEPVLHGIPKERLPDGYPRTWYTVWQRRK